MPNPSDSTLSMTALVWSDTDDHGRSISEGWKHWDEFTPHGDCSPALGRDIFLYDKGLGVRVYIVCGNDGQALYVGVSSDVAKRIKQHRKNKPWWRSEVSAIWSSQPVCCRRHAMQYERAMQRTLHPTYNTMQESMYA